MFVTDPATGNEMIPIIAILIILVLLGLLFISFMKLSSSVRRASELEEKVFFFDQLLDSKDRIALWIFPSGRVQTTQRFLSLTGCEDLPTTLDDLKTVFPPDVITHLIENNDNFTQDVSVVVAQRLGRSDIILEINPIRNCPDHMPDKLVWLAESKLDNRLEADNQSSSLIDHRLTLILGILDNLPVPLWTWNRQGQLNHVNSAYVSAVDGQSVNHTIENQIMLISPEKGQNPAKLAHTVLDDAKIVRERAYAIIDGVRKSLLIVHKNIPETDSILSVALDMTGEENALSELSRVLESQSVTLNRLASPVAIFGPDQELKFFNQAFVQLTGLGENQLMENIQHDRILDEMRMRRRLPEQANFKEWKETILKQYRELMEPLEDIWHFPNGETYRIVTQPHPLGGLLLLFEDMTDTLALQQSVNTLTAVQSETLENLHEAVAVFGTDSNLRLCNKGFISLWGLEDLEKETPALLNIHISTICLQAQKVFQPREYSETDSVLENLPVWLSQRSQKTGVWQTNEGRVIDYAIVPLPDGSSLLTQIDITDSFHIQQALRERGQALETADRMKSEFIANMAYELRTPLNTIIGFAELLLQGLYGTLDDKQTDVLANIRLASETLNDLITNVLDIAVIDSGAAELDLSKIDLHQLTAAVVDMAVHPKRRKEVHLAYHNTKPIQILADENRIKQVIFSLVSAAISLSEVHETVTLSLEKINKKSVQITVCIDKILLIEKDFHHLVDSVIEGRTVSMNSTGNMDLMIVRSITEIHKGSLSFDYSETQQALINVTLPVDPTKKNLPQNIGALMPRKGSN